MTGDATALLNEIARVLQMGTKKMTMKNHRDLIEKITKKKDLVMLVIDEVDNMISTRGGAAESGSSKILRSLCELATDPGCKFSLVGISNAVDNAVAKTLTQIGMVSCVSLPLNDQLSSSLRITTQSGKRIPFAPYSQDDLVNLVVTRIGSSRFVTIP